jgi:hypothetical protein
MAYGLVGLYAIYFIMVGMRGNAQALLTDAQNDGKGYIVWIVAIIILRAMYGSDTLRPLVKPFIALAALTFVLKNYKTISAQLNTLLPANAQVPT